MMSKMNIRSFTSEGRKKFEILIQDTDMMKTEDINFKKFSDLAKNPTFSEAVGGADVVDSAADLGSTKYSMCNYLHPKLFKLGVPHLMEDHGLWEWLACFYIEKFIRTGNYGKGQRNKKDQALNALNREWLLIGRESFYETRHVIKIFMYYYDRFNQSNDPDIHSKVLLSGNITQFGEIANVFFVDTTPIMNKNFIKYINKNFYNGDDENGMPNPPNQGLGGRDHRAARNIKPVSKMIASTYDLDEISYNLYEKLMQKDLTKLKNI